MINEIVNTTLFWVIIFVGYWWFVRVNVRLSLAELRHQLFKVRGKLFDRGYELGIDFDSDAYGIARTTLNGLLRFAHKLSFPQILLMVLVSKKYLGGEESSNYQKSLDTALEKLPAEQKELIKAVLHDANKAVLLYVVKTSLVLNVVLIPMALIAILLQKTGELKQKIVKSSFAKDMNSILDAEANSIGHKV